jgi:hypothetical protein
MSSRRASAYIAASAVIVLVALTVVGRWERSRQIHDQAAGMLKILRLIGPLDNPTLAGFRVLPPFDCLTYRRSGNGLALEVCVDAAGRVVQAIDRRTIHRHFWTLQFEPSASPVRVSWPEVQRLVRKMEAR